MDFAIRQYSVPLLLAVMLHVAGMWALYNGWNPEKEVLNIIKPRAVMANLIVLEAKAQPVKPEPRPAPTVRQSKPENTDSEAAREQQRRNAEEAARRKQEERTRAEQQRKEAERLERIARLNALAQTSLNQAIAAESADLQAGDEEQVAQSFRLGIYDLVRRNWSRPPSARNGMSARLQVELIPTGEVVVVTIVESSGNSAFDRSAEQAVRRAKRFEVPAENAVFERYFRRFYFLFQPEDLLR